MSKILIALGGNALGKDNSEQIDAVKKAATMIADLYIEGHELIICHGNGPQVGVINNSFLEGMREGIIKEEMPFPECIAMSQGYIGYHIQMAIENELRKRKVGGSVVALTTQTIVSKDDPAFNSHSKPIGGYMTDRVAHELADKYKWVVKEEKGKGWRRVVSSPKPLSIVEIESIEILFKNDVIVIAAGGGGVPVYEENNQLVPIDAVIDKDLTSSKLAELIKVDKFIILTAEDKIIIKYGTPKAIEIDEISVSELKKLIDSNEFEEGSMRPKVIAAAEFVEATGNDAFIADLLLADQVLSRKAGTKITKD